MPSTAHGAEARPVKSSSTRADGADDTSLSATTQSAGGVRPAGRATATHCGAVVREAPADAASPPEAG